MTGSKKIFGLSGLIASGKGAAAGYFKKKYRANVYRFSTMLRDILDRLYLEHTRDNLVKMSECLRSTFGEDILAKTVAKDVENDPHRVIVVEGIRRLADIKYLSKLPGFILVEIFADSRVRYERLIKRGENEDDMTKTYKQFLADHRRSTEITIPKVTAQARERIDNNGDLKDLHRQIDKIVKSTSKP